MVRPTVHGSRQADLDWPGPAQRSAAQQERDANMQQAKGRMSIMATTLSFVLVYVGEKLTVVCVCLRRGICRGALANLTAVCGQRAVLAHGSAQSRAGTGTAQQQMQMQEKSPAKKSKSAAPQQHQYRCKSSRLFSLPRLAGRQVSRRTGAGRLRATPLCRDASWAPPWPRPLFP